MTPVVRKNAKIKIAPIMNGMAVSHTSGGNMRRQPHRIAVLTAKHSKLVSKLAVPTTTLPTPRLRIRPRAAKYSSRVSQNVCVPHLMQ